MNLYDLSDDAFYQTIIEAYSDMVIRIAYQNTFNKYDAEDITQEVFIRLYREKTFKDEAHMKAWLIRVTINLCKDLKKSFWHRNVGSLVEEWKPFTDSQNNILNEIKALPVKYRNVIYLHYFEGYSHREIADILAVNENTVGSWIRRAKKELGAMILDGGERNE